MRIFTKTMKQRIITGFIFFIVIVIFFIGGFFYPLVLSLLWLIVAAIGGYELLRAGRNKGIRPCASFVLPGVMLSAIPVVVHYVSPSMRLMSVFGVYAIALFCYLLLVVIFHVIARTEEDAFLDALYSASVILYLSFPLACAQILTLFVPNGWFFLLIGLFSPWVSDVFAYFSGVFFGKKKIIEHISPKKTWGGTIGGIIGSIIVLIAFFAIFSDIMLGEDYNLFSVLLFAAILGLILSIVSQLGDWLASALKRWLKIKDFGRLLPGHGGLLDRFDSAFFTLPATLVVLLLFRGVFLS